MPVSIKWMVYFNIFTKIIVALTMISPLGINGFMNVFYPNHHFQLINKFPHLCYTPFYDMIPLLFFA